MKNRRKSIAPSHPERTGCRRVLENSGTLLSIAFEHRIRVCGTFFRRGREISHGYFRTCVVFRLQR